MANKFQTILDILRFRYKYKGEYIFAVKKKYFFEKNKDKINTIILGSSHGQYAYLPENIEEFNMCLPSQDIYYSKKLYEYAIKNVKNLKNIILFYSVFSPGYEMDKTNERFRCAHYLFLYGILPNNIKSVIYSFIEYLFRFFDFKKYASIKNIDSTEYWGSPYNAEGIITKDIYPGGG